MIKFSPYPLVLLFSFCSPTAKETDTALDSTTVAPADELHDADYGIYHYTFLVNKSLPRYSLKFHPPDKKIYLYNNPTEDGSPVTELPLSEDIDYGEGYYAENTDANFNLIDYNFDGYRDVSVIASAGASNVWYTLYLFDPASGKFLMHEQLSKLTSLEADSVARILTYHDNGGMAGAWYSDGVIQWQGGKPVTIREEEQTSSADNQEIFVRTIKVRGTDGQMKVACSVEIAQGANNKEIQCLTEGEWTEFDKSPRLIYAETAENVVKMDGRNGGCNNGDEGEDRN